MGAHQDRYLEALEPRGAQKIPNFEGLMKKATWVGVGSTSYLDPGRVPRVLCCPLVPLDPTVQIF